MKKVLSIILILCTLVALLVPAASAADTEKETLQRAVVETALAYYYKGNAVQYDSYYLAAGDRDHGAILRQTNNRSPEDSSADNIHFSVCSAFPHDVYMNVFNDHVINQDRQQKMFKYAGQFEPYLKGVTMNDAQLDYALGLLGVTDDYCNMGNLWYDTNMATNPGNMVVAYWGPETVTKGVGSNFRGMFDYNGNGQLDSGETTLDADKLKAMMEPGDIIAAIPRKSDNTASGGHTMMYLGKVLGDNVNRIIHCNGAKYDNAGSNEYTFMVNGEAVRGFDIWETAKKGSSGTRNGAIYVATYSGFMGGPSISNQLKGEKWYAGNCFEYAVLRPVNAYTSAKLTENAKFRLHHPAVVVTKTTDVKPYNDVRIGNKITYTVQLENATKDSYGISGGIGSVYGAVYKDSVNLTYNGLMLEETVPAGTTLVSADGATVNGNTLTWAVSSLAPGKTTRLSYTVEVTGNSITGTQGKVYVASRDGYVSTPAIEHEVVGQKLTVDTFSGVTTGMITMDASVTREGTDVVEDLYAAVGYKVKVPHAQEIIDSITSIIGLPNNGGSNARVLLQDASELTGAAKTLREMIVPGFVGGKQLHTVDANGIRTNANRLQDLNQAFLQPGDVLVYANFENSRTAVKNEEAYVYLGDDNFAYYNNGTLTKLADPVKYYAMSDSDEDNIYTGSEIASDAGSYTSNGTGSYKIAYSKVLYQSLMHDFFVCLRPSRVWDGKTEKITATTEVKPVQNATTGTYYKSLAEAYAAAAEGDTLKLHEDLALANTLTVTKPLTIDLNGYTVRPASEDFTGVTMDVQDNSTVKNGTVYGTVFISTNNKTLTVQDATLIGRNVVGTSGSYKWYGAALGKANRANITLERVNVTTEYKNTEYSDYSPIQTAGATPSYTATTRVTMKDDVVLLVPLTTESGKVAKGAYEKFGKDNGVNYYPGTKTRALDDSNPSVTGNYYKAVTFTANPAATVGTSQYASLSDAVNALSAGQTLTLNRDVDLSAFNEVCADWDTKTGKAKYLLKPDYPFTLDLNSCTITDMSANRPAAGSAAPLRITKAGETVVKNGTIKAWGMGISVGSAELILENVNIYSGGHGVFMSHSGKDTQSVTVKGGKIISGVYDGQTGNALTVYRGSVNLSDDALLLSNTNEAVCLGYSTKGYVGTAAVSEATVGASFYAYNLNAGGHTETTNGSEFNLAEGTKKQAGKAVTEMVDGVAYDFVADGYSGKSAVKIGDKDYASLSEAVTAAKSGETVSIVEDYVADESVTIPAGVTLDLGAKTLTMADGKTLTVAGTVTAEGGKVGGKKSQVVLTGNGNYMGITVPAGITQTVHPDVALSAAEVTVEAVGTLKLTAAATGYANVDLWDTKLAANMARIMAKEMDTVYTVAPVVRDGDVYYVGAARELSVKGETEAKLAKVDWTNETEAKQGRAMVALLNYGAEAKKLLTGSTMENAYLNTYKTQMSALTSQLDTARKDSSYVIGSDPDVVYGASAAMEDTLKPVIYFGFEDGKYNNLTFTVTCGSTTKTLALSDLAAAGGNETVKYYRLVVDGISQSTYDTVITVKVAEGTNTLATVTDTLASYAARLHGFNNGTRTTLANAMLLYGMAAKAAKG